MLKESNFLTSNWWQILAGEFRKSSVRNLDTFFKC